MERKFYFEVDAEGLIVGSVFLYDFEAVPDFTIEPWPEEIVMNVPKYNFSTGVWEEIGEPVPEVEYPSEGSEHFDEPQESTEDESQETIEEQFEKIKGEIADLKDRLEQQEALLFELMGGEGDPFE